MRFNILVSRIGAKFKNLRGRPNIVTSPGAKNGFVPEIAGLAAKEDLIAVGSDGEVTFIHACAYDAGGKEPGAVTRSRLTEIIATDCPGIA